MKRGDSYSGIFFLRFSANILQNRAALTHQPSSSVATAPLQDPPRTTYNPRQKCRRRPVALLDMAVQALHSPSRDPAKN